jgi:hypothetical protein
VEVPWRCGQRYRRLASDAVAQLTSAFGRCGEGLYSVVGCVARERESAVRACSETCGAPWLSAAPADVCGTGARTPFALLRIHPHADAWRLLAPVLTILT